jgi:hypothetical protein
MKNIRFFQMQRNRRRRRSSGEETKKICSSAIGCNALGTRSFSDVLFPYLQRMLSEIICLKFGVF